MDFKKKSSKDRSMGASLVVERRATCSYSIRS
jgi:hypothetical protein